MGHKAQVGGVFLDTVGCLAGTAAFSPVMAENTGLIKAAARSMRQDLVALQISQEVYLNCSTSHYYAK
jgi:hypothetical protein